MRTSTGLRIAGQPDDLIEHCVSKQVHLPSLAIAGNDKVISQYNFKHDSQSLNISEHPDTSGAKVNVGVLKQYNSFNSYLNDDGDEIELVGAMRTIVANQCTFTALSDTGEVWTWGDGRYEACSGREISDSK